MAQRRCSAPMRRAALFTSFGNGSSQPSHKETARGWCQNRSGPIDHFVCIDFLMSWKKFLCNLLSAAPLLPRRLSLATFALGSWLPPVFLPGLICLVSCNLSWMRGKAINPSCFLSLWSLFYLSFQSLCCCGVCCPKKKQARNIGPCNSVTSYRFDSKQLQQSSRGGSCSVWKAASWLSWLVSLLEGCPTRPAVHGPKKRCCGRRRKPSRCRSRLSPCAVRQGSREEERRG